MKRYLNLMPERAWKYITVCLLTGFTGANAQHITRNAYNNETEIKATGSVTLTDGFHIPAGKTVRIFTGASFKECVPFAGILSTDQNYVSTKIFKVPQVLTDNDVALAGRSTCDVNQTVQYFDGLGRPLQTVTVQGSPSFKDLVQPVAYDAFGREQFKYLPYVATAGSNGAFKTGAVAAQAAFYASPSAGVASISGAFSEIRFEASPLNRVQEQGAPGTSWQLAANGTGHTLKTEYGSNNASAAYSTTGFAVRLYTAVPVTASGQEHQRTLSGTGYYTANELYLTISKDENWVSNDGKAGTTEEYKDKEGRVVLKRLFNRKPDNSIETLSTYYVYDDLGNLSFVLPPGANPDAEAVPSATVQDNFCYQYRYDGRKRLIEKKIPGKGWEDMVYNKLDQLVLSRDAEQRNSQKWLFTKYDALGRVVMTGLHSNATERVNLQPLVDAQGTLWESRDNANSNSTGTGYTNLTLPNTGIETYLTINYYDDYDFHGNSFPPPNGTTQMPAARTKGLQTGSFVYQLGSSTTRYLSVNYYDEEGRIIRTAADNHLGGKDYVDNTWNFAGELTASTRSHTGASGPATTIATRYDYDHMGRKLATMQSINGQPEVVLSKLAYNEIGQLLKKELHSNDNGGSFLQKTDYAYNERGWLNNTTSDQFSMRLKYDVGTYPQYNGNIANQEWGAGNSYPNVYTYDYDKLNRLKSGVSTGVVMSEFLTYDVMGNIASMNRDGAGVSTYNYANNDNKLTSISGPLATGTYMYDLNGNATTDGRTGVTIGYNILNLPSTVSKSGLSMSYVYDAAGGKLRKVSSSEATSDYVDGIQYTGGAIDFIMTEEGKARNNGGTYVYEYNLTDHLGNVRYTFNQHPSTYQLQQLQADNYYPFGKQRVASAGVNKYLYNGKELQNELGQLDYGARFYDPEIGRWNVVDPLAEKFLSVNPYNYTDNNPVNNIDPNGMETYYGEEAQGMFRQMQTQMASRPPDEYYIDANGNRTKVSNKGGTVYDYYNFAAGTNDPLSGKTLVVSHSDEKTIPVNGKVPNLQAKKYLDAAASINSGLGNIAEAGEIVVSSSFSASSRVLSTSKVLGVLKNLGTATFVTEGVIEVGLGVTGNQTKGETMKNVGISTIAWGISSVASAGAGFVIGGGLKLATQDLKLKGNYSSNPMIKQADATRYVIPIIK
ncbi:DUF6443 domain-containing protein [Pedobacter africanus]|uniref:RHS repeat-associated core domain-containing protein n=1 Tax=Pedobacter africanus TaxID=151894 RepID=A0A1W2BSL1_9SPHI|nr:DUF6443 domain-containing protein [Pedobacter africanus]SMC75592.1 RHS repeat-associated core domain-containing protein [Pedobacter africanus]